MERKSFNKERGRSEMNRNTNRNPFRSENAGIYHTEIGAEFTEDIRSKVEKCEEKQKNFERIYKTWRNKRLQILQELEELMEKVHEDQLAFNKTNIIFKGVNVKSRVVKQETHDEKVDFWASLATFITDTASGITSIAQAVNIEAYNKTFKELMERDAIFTKPLYAARSQCMAQYRGVEEVIRQYHSKSFDEAVNGISDTMKIENLWSDLKWCYKKNDVNSLFASVDSFVVRTSRSEVWNRVTGTFREYVDSNPAAFEACKSTGKALYSAFDTWGRDREEEGGRCRLSVTGSACAIANHMLVNEGRRELQQLQSVVACESEPQAKLESDIRDAIASFKFELNEMLDAFNAMF